MVWQITTKPVQVARHVVQFFIELLKLKGFIKVVYAPHVLWYFDWVYCHKVLESWLGPEVQGVEDVP